jgi:hypothetical protein
VGQGGWRPGAGRLATGCGEATDHATGTPPTKGRASTDDVSSTSLVTDTPARRLRDALEPLAAQGFSSAREPMKALGLRFVEGYVWGRAAALGEPSSAVVVAAFGVFEPTFLAAAYERGRATVTRDQILVAREAGAEERLQEVLGDDPDVGRMADVLLGAIDSVSGAGRPLFSGLREVERPETPAGRLWRAADLVREHRGDGHLAACIAAGLDPIEMNILTELWVGYPLREYSSTRGHSAEAIDAGIERVRARGWLDGDQLSAAGATIRSDIEAGTDSSQDQLVAALGDDLDWLVPAASALSAKVVAAGAFTPDERKRAAG